MPDPANDAPIAIRLATAADRDAVLSIFMSVISTGETYVYPPDMPRAEAEAAWFSADGHTYVAERGGEIVGTYALRTNRPGLGNHVANCGYMVAPGLFSRGVGSSMCDHSLDEARRLGFRAMQFNFVVSTNTRAVDLWKRMGFKIVGVVPGAFRHHRLGDVDAFIMHRWL